MIPEDKRSCWLPTPEQELLLRAAFLHDESAIAAWHRWRSSTDIENLDGSSYRLMPQLYRNLLSLGIGDPLMDRLKSVHRHAWSKNQMLLHHSASVIRSFSENGIETIVLKGVALVSLYYKDWAVRPMSDIDVLVPTAKAKRAIDLLADLGWQAKSRWPERQIAVRHSTDFSDDGGRSVDLHWHLLWENCRSDADDDFWEASNEACIAGLQTRVLCPADQLLQVCIHGSAWNTTPAFRWVADALTIIRSAGSELDWDRLLTQSKKRRLALPICAMLTYLRERFDARVPIGFLQNVKAAPVTKRERIEYQVKMRPMRGLTSLLVFWFMYSRSQTGLGFTRRLAAFPRYLQHNWGLERPWQVPDYMVTRVARRNFGRLASHLRRHAQDAGARAH